MRHIALVVTTTAAVFCVSAPLATAAKKTSRTTKAAEQQQTPPEQTATETQSDVVGGLEFGAPIPDGPTAPGSQAKIVNGVAQAPENAPDEVKRVIWAGNKILGTKYRYGGGHQGFTAEDGLDCSGTISFALNGGNFLERPFDSTDFMGWGDFGQGDWITVHTNPGHAYMIVAGLRLDTSGDSKRNGIVWQKPKTKRLKNGRYAPDAGYRQRHPAGF